MNRDPREDDGIPVLTEVVAATELPPGAAVVDQPDTAGPDSHLLFPELEVPPAAAAAFAADIEERVLRRITSAIDALLAERLTAVMPEVVEAAVAGVRAGLEAAISDSVRDAVTQAVAEDIEAATRR